MKRLGKNLFGVVAFVAVALFFCAGVARGQASRKDDIVLNAQERSLGGVPVPSTAQENQWTASQHFKGPNPWRDFTAYMKDSNGNPVNCSSTTPVNGADTTGTISSGSTTLTLAAARDFKNGCGIAVLGAGPTSTLAVPVSTATFSAASRSGSTTVTVTTTGSHGLNVGSGNGSDQGVVMSGCSVGAYNGTFAMTSIADSTHFTYTAGSSATDSATGCSISFLFGYVHGTTGSTTYNYKVVAIDANEGYSAASSTLTITSANATLTKDNWNWIGYPYEANVAMYALYSDKGLGGALTCVNISFTMAVIDVGSYNPCPPFLPTNPPTTAGPQTLFTTISSGAGTTMLTLAASASNTATTKNVYHDESSFLNSCITDTNTDLTNGGFNAAAYGCYIPAGTWGMNGPILTSSLTPSGYLPIKVAGMLNFQTQPWFIKSAYNISGIGGGGIGGGTADHTASTKIQFGPAVPGGFVLGTGAFSATVSGFMMQYINGTGVWIGATSPASAPSGVAIDNMSINEQGTAGNAPCITIDNNVIGLWMRRNTCQAVAGAGGMPALYLTHAAYSSQVDQIIHSYDFTSLNHTVKLDAPGGIAVGGAAPHDISLDHWFQENSNDIGVIRVDNGTTAPGQGGVALSGITLSDILTSDGGVTSAIEEFGGISTIQSVFLNNSPGGVACTPITLCPSNLGMSNYLSIASATPKSRDANGFVIGVTNNFADFASGGIGLIPAEVNAGSNPARPIFGVLLPAPQNFAVNSTGAGSLAAGTWCGAVSGLDANSYETDTSNVACSTVGTNSRITFGLTPGNSNSLSGAYGGFNGYYCLVSSGTTCTPNKKITGIAAGATTWTLTADTGSNSQLPSVKAMLSWLAMDKTNPPLSCFFCVNSGSDAWPIGIGRLPAASLGYNLIADKGYAFGEIADPACATSGIGQLWENSTSHRVKFCSNAGTPDTVPGLATTDTLSNKSTSAGPLTGTVASGTATMTTAAIAAGNCGATVTVSAANVATTDTITWAFNAAPAGSNAGLVAWPTANNVNFAYCPNSAETPAAATINWRVVR